MTTRLFMLTEAAVFASLIAVGSMVPSDTVILALIAFATVVFQAWQTRQVNRVHAIVNSQRTAMEAVIQKLEIELARVSAGGTPTPTTVPAPQVSILDGVVSTSKEAAGEAPAEETIPADPLTKGSP